MNRGLLQNVYLFKTMTSNELAAIGELVEVRTYNQGDTVFMRGESAKALYLIKNGSIRIQQTAKNGDTMDMAVLGTGSHFGEMSFVDNEPRSASAVAAERTEIMVLPYEKIGVYLAKNLDTAVKFYRELAHFLAGRLRVTTSDLTYAKEKNLSHF